MKWFGEVAWAPVCEPAEHVRTPLNQVCLSCEEMVMTGDSGFIMYSREDEGAAIHRECMLRSVMGSPLHILGRCTCQPRRRTWIFGPADAPLPEKMTRRQEAQWVWDFAQRASPLLPLA